MVMGQRNSLFWDLPALDAFEVHRTVYRVPGALYRSQLDELVELLDLDPLLGQAGARALASASGCAASSPPRCSTGPRCCSSTNRPSAWT